MDEEIVLTRAAFFGILDRIGMPNPDEPGEPDNPFGPYGPGGPVSFDLSWVMLNPQPLPPRWMIESAARQFGPRPEPWSARSAVQWVVQNAMHQVQLAEVLGNSDHSEQSIIIVSGYIREIVEDWCGTGKQRWPWPKPRRRFGDDEVDGLDLLLAGREFQRFADMLNENPLQDDLATAAAQLTEVGLSRLAG